MTDEQTSAADLADLADDIADGWEILVDGQVGVPSLLRASVGTGWVYIVRDHHETGEETAAAVYVPFSDATGLSAAAFDPGQTVERIVAQSSAGIGPAAAGDPAPAQDPPAAPAHNPPREELAADQPAESSAGIPGAEHGNHGNRRAPSLWDAKLAAYRADNAALRDRLAQQGLELPPELAELAHESTEDRARAVAAQNTALRARLHAGGAS